MKWNIITICFCTLALLFNAYLWINYIKKTTKKKQNSDGWNSFHLVSTFLILLVLLNRIAQL
jgi:hypothetical protein